MNPAKAPFRATYFPPADMRVERRADGTLVGYGGGLWRKERLLDHERSVLSQLKN